MVNRISGKIILKTMIIAACAYIMCSSSAMAGCGWFESSECYKGSDSHGATIDNPSQPYDVTDVSYKIMVIMPAWWCQGTYIPPECPCYAYEHTYTWQPDPNNPCCGSADAACCGKETICVDGDTKTCLTSEGCLGTQTCNSCKWSTCKPIDPCCGDPDTCCKEKNKNQDATSGR